MKIKTNIILAATTLMLFACDAKKEKEETTTEEETVKTVVHQFTSVDENTAKHIKDVIDNYLLLKDDLVKSDSSSTIKTAELIKKSIESFDAKLIAANQREVYEKNMAAIKTEVDDIIKLPNINQQREVFAELTENVYELAKAFGYSKTLYYEHCPMALNDKGAMWLSAESEIKNPYFGDEMLSCGSVKEEIK